jgi:hypothetical protein
VQSVNEKSVEEESIGVSELVSQLKYSVELKLEKSVV